MPHANVTVGMPPGMIVDVEEEAKKHDMSRAEYIRHLIRQAHDSPFDTPETVLCKDENGQNRADSQKEGAA
jgi:hypothetical protein